MSTKSSSFPQGLRVEPGKKQYLNPGAISKLHKKVKNLRPVIFDGIQFNFKKAVSPSKTIITNWVLSHTFPSGFRVGGIYHGKCEGNILETPIIEADINPSTLSSNVSVLYYPTQFIKLEAKLQNIQQSNVESSQFIGEYIGRSSTFTAALYNPSREKGRLTLSYMNSIAKYLSGGMELCVELKKNRLTANMAMAMRYAPDKYALAASISPNALDVTYWRRIHKFLQIGTSLRFNSTSKKAEASMCYQWDFKDAFVKGLFDSNFSVGLMYNRKITNLPCTLSLSVLFCIPSSRFAYGITIDLDPTSTC